MNTELIQKYIICSLANEFIAMPINIVKEIIDLDNYVISKIPGAVSSVIGVINLRGQIIPLLDSRQKLDFGLDVVFSKNPKAIIIEKEKEIFGLLVDEVHQVAEILERNVEISLDQPISKDVKIGTIFGKDINEKEKPVFILSEEKLFNSNNSLVN